MLGNQNQGVINSGVRRKRNRGRGTRGGNVSVNHFSSRSNLKLCDDISGAETVGDAVGVGACREGGNVLLLGPLWSRTR